MDLSGFALETLREDYLTALCRARRSGDGASLLVAMPVAPDRTASCRHRFEHEHALADELDDGWAAKPTALGHHRGQPILLLADPGGDPLGHSVAGPLETPPFLVLALAIAAAVCGVHARGLIHKDLRPANILVAPTGAVWLTGFGIASRLRREKAEPTSVRAVRGTLAYMAPEQTGRMNRSVDQRSDLYALGVIFYELLAGSLPFNAAEPADWFHSHIARPPVPLRERAPRVPPVLESIVLKLLAKRAEDRYQSIIALEADLRRCLEGSTESGRIAPFDIAENDRPNRLLIPESLYGRSEELEKLIGVFAGVVKTGQSEVVLVSGPAGIGKSTLVGELGKVAATAGALFAAGKFDQYRRDVPFAALGEALQGLVRQILTLDDDRLEPWRRAIGDAVGPSGDLLSSLVPDLAPLIGEQRPAPDLPPQDAQTRLTRTFRRLLGAFARPDHPLVLVLDDVHWLDSGTIQLMEWLAVERDVPHLLLVAAYRDGEVEAGHPFAEMLARMRGTRPPQELHLTALQQEVVTCLLADVFNASAETIQPLADLVYDKTGGNPFFVAQFLNALFDEALVAFDHGANAWRWDHDRILAKRITENVAALMLSRLSRLPAPALRALAILACLGHATPRSVFAAAMGASEREAADALRPAVEAGFVLHSGADDVFAHDRVHEAAYALLPEAERPATHLAIARGLVARLPPAELDALIFTVADQFARASAPDTSEAERVSVAALYLRAGTRAKEATAFPSALKYLRAGAALLPQAGADRLAFELDLAIAECEFLTGCHRAAGERLSVLARHARGAADRAAVTRLRLALYTTLGDNDRAIAVGLEYLEDVGCGWNVHPDEAVVEVEIATLHRLLAGRSILSLSELPRMTNVVWLSAMDVLAWMILPALITDKSLEAALILRMANLSLEHGNCDASAYAFSQMNVILGPRFGDYELGLGFGRLSLDLVERHGLDRYKARVYCCYSCYVSPWSEHLPASVAIARRAIEIADAVGDPVFAVATARLLVTILLVSGAALEDAQKEAEEYLSAATKSGFSLAADGASSALLLVRELRCPAGGDADALAAERLAFEQHLLDTPQALVLPLAWYLVHRMQATYLAGDLVAAADATRRATAVLDATRTFVDIAEYHFYGALILSASCSQRAARADASDLDQLAAHHRQMTLWAAHCPENFVARADLIAAEIAALEDRGMDALRLYERAAHTARETGFVQVEAIASERAAAYCVASGLATAANAHHRVARESYVRWGAQSVVARLDRSRPPGHEPSRPDEFRLRRDPRRAGSTRRRSSRWHRRSRVRSFSTRLSSG